MYDLHSCHWSRGLHHLPLGYHHRSCDHFLLSAYSLLLASISYYRNIGLLHFPLLLESWWDIGFEGNGGVKSKQPRVCNSKGKCHSPIYYIFPYYYRPFFTPLLPSNPICHQLSHREFLKLLVTFAGGEKISYRRERVYT